MRARGRGFAELGAERQEMQLWLNLLYGRWLREEATGLGLRVAAAADGPPAI